MKNSEQKNFVDSEVDRKKEELNKMSYFQLEDLAHEILESGKIHPEIAKKIEKEILEDEDLNREKLIRIILKLRKILKADKEKNHFKEVFSQSGKYYLNQEIMKEITENLVKIRERVETLKNKAENFLGKGSVAEVYSSGRNGKTCFKLIFNFNEYQKGNDLEEEMNFLDEVVQLGEIAGVRVPMPFYFWTEKEFCFLVMEKLEAVSLEDVFKRKASLPDNFNEEDFFKSLEEFVKTLHEKKKIHHRDLHEGNVMIDLVTGKPRVIDFGLARFIYFDEEKERDLRGKKSGVNDFEMIKKLKKEMKKFRKIYRS